MARSARERSLKHNTYPTLVAVESIVVRPYKVRVEVRRTRSNRYSVTIVGLPRVIEHLANQLRESGYNCIMYLDAYGYGRIHIPNLLPHSIPRIHDIVRGVLRGRRRSVEEHALASV